MKKIGLIFDSASSLTVKDAEDKGVGFIPLNIHIDGKEYQPGVNLTNEELYEAMKNKDTKVMTSLPTGKNIESTLNDMLEKYEKVIFIGISSKWSGTQNAVRQIAESDDKFKDRVYVYNSLFSSPWISLFMDDAIRLVNEYENVEDFFKLLDTAQKYMVAYLSPGNIWWFYKGGRITKMQYIAGSVAKIKPVLKYIDGSINEEGVIKARGVEKAMIAMTDNIKKDIASHHNLPKDLYKIIVLKGNNEDLLRKTEETLMFEMGLDSSKIIPQKISSDQIAHLGPDSFGIGLYVSLDSIIKAKLD